MTGRLRAGAVLIATAPLASRTRDHRLSVPGQPHLLKARAAAAVGQVRDLRRALAAAAEAAQALATAAKEAARTERRRPSGRALP